MGNDFPKNFHWPQRSEYFNKIRRKRPFGRSVANGSSPASFVVPCSPGIKCFSSRARHIFLQRALRTSLALVLVGGPGGLASGAFQPTADLTRVEAQRRVGRLEAHRGARVLLIRSGERSRSSSRFAKRKHAKSLLPAFRSRDYGLKMMVRSAPLVIALMALGLSACTNPYDPVQRGLGGGILGAASGAAIGAAAGGGPGAALGAAIGGATGIFGGLVTTPPPPPGTYYGYPVYGYPYGYPAYYGAPGYPGPAAYGYQGDRVYPAYSGSPTYEYRDGDRGNPAYPGSPSHEYQGSPLYPPEAGFGYSVYAYPGDRAAEDWPPGAGHDVEPSS
jgi:hypothetical protein